MLRRTVTAERPEVGADRVPRGVAGSVAPAVVATGSTAAHGPPKS